MNTEAIKYFNQFHKDELSTILSYFEREIPKKAKKAELVELVTEFIGGHPREWLYRLPERDLRLMRMLCNAGPENWMEMISPEYPSVAAVLGLIYVDDNSFDEVMASIDRTLYFPVASIIDQVIKEKENDGSFEIERLALGLLNIYGAIPVENFVENVFGMFDEDETGKDVTLAMAECPIISINRLAYKDNIYLISPYAYDYEAIIDGREEFEEIREFPVYTKKDVIGAGTHSPFCAFRNEEYYAVKEILDGFGYDEDEIEREIHRIWMNSQHASDDESTEAIFNCINSRIEEIDSFDTYRHYIDIIAAYANSIPKWLLKGSTSKDAGLLQLSIKVEDMMTDAEEESTDEEALGPLKEFYKYNMAVRHVAPDDPCPCGSGLSYCRCHGKRLN